MEFGLSRIMAAMHSPNPISGTSQLSHFAAVEMTKPGIGVKNCDFLPIFDILSCTTTASSEVAIPWVSEHRSGSTDTQAPGSNSSVLPRKINENV